MTNDEVAARINQRRKQVLVHSVIYYRFGDSIVDDVTWNRWARELYELQCAYPTVASKCWRSDIFKDFDPASGYYLPLHDVWATRKAQWLMDYHRLGGLSYEQNYSC